MKKKNYSCFIFFFPSSPFLFSLLIPCLPINEMNNNNINMNNSGGPKRSWNYVGHVSGFVDGHSARGNDAGPLCLTLNLNRYRKG